MKIDNCLLFDNYIVTTYLWSIMINYKIVSYPYFDGSGRKR